MRFRTYTVALTACLILGFLFLPMPSHAADTGKFSVLIGYWTRHVDRSDDTNEKTGMIAFLYNDYMISRFKNSYSDETLFAGKRFHTKKFGLGKFKHLSVQGNLYAGLMHGYSDNLPNIGGISPGVLPTVGLLWKKASVELGYIPTPSGGVFMSLIRFPLKLPWIIEIRLRFQVAALGFIAPDTSSLKFRTIKQRLFSQTPAIRNLWLAQRTMFSIMK